MINRELIRIKIVQLTYAYYQNGSKNMDTAEKELLVSLSKAYDMYNLLLDLIVAITREERRRLEILTQRAVREGTDKPSDKFAFNKFAVQLEDNKMLNEFLEDKKLSWREDIDFVRALCGRIEQSELYKAYMAEPAGSYDDDREFWRKLYKQFIEENEDLDALFEEKSLYWNDDKAIVDTFVLKTIKRFDPANKGRQPLLPEYKDGEDKEFARKLFRATILNANDYQRYMSQTSRNWDFSRLAYMDIVVMQIAIAEMLNFPNIPVSVTINEYVELAKYYSTPRSGGYVNGMLDSIARYLIDTGKMMKEMPPRPPRRPTAERRAPYDRQDGQGRRQGLEPRQGYGEAGGFDPSGGRQAPLRFVHHPKEGESGAEPAEPSSQAAPVADDAAAQAPQPQPEQPDAGQPTSDNNQ